MSGCLLQLLHLVLSAITTVIVIFMMFCIIFVYRNIQKWRPLVDQVMDVMLPNENTEKYP
jgi:hypothetical protein